MQESGQKGLRNETNGSFKPNEIDTEAGQKLSVTLSVVNTRNEPMPLKLLRVVPTPGLSKKYAAVFVLPNGRQRTVRFGTASNYVSNPRKTARG